MNAIAIEANVDENNELRIKLPEQHRGQHARVIVLFPSTHQPDAGNPPRHHKPSPQLAHKGALIHGDDLTPAFSDEEWGELVR